MVSPSDKWTDTEHGYERGETSVTVRKMNRVAFEDGDRMAGDVFSVTVWRGPERHEEIAAYEEPKRAWELANLLTHLIDETSPVMMQLTGESGSPLPRDLTDKDPEDVLRDALGYNEMLLDRALESDS